MCSVQKSAAKIDFDLLDKECTVDVFGLCGHRQPMLRFLRLAGAFGNSNIDDNNILALNEPGIYGLFLQQPLSSNGGGVAPHSKPALRLLLWPSSDEMGDEEEIRLTTTLLRYFIQMTGQVQKYRISQLLVVCAILLKYSFEFCLFMVSFANGVNGFMTYVYE